ncbi:MAG: branched-chain amino acid ABC transporter permease [Candidatus Woesearchaeota archaeon]|jgi:branched-chain amino acid transport system permease protein|nr:branched-chain amino acid ABC transporter permease [archaeon]MDP6547870.1 branched-chain amino acid ABC transporter permease [Candidatus Woesearchaeota archaeon]MDP7263103.1 branched-chain amino acid ABC transporter permease [Candidatus Woesearchaeota archaeon]MDP7623182.1 branched-chain amino acid ABC transporter permease [Candidatus Woesearchaeota archaeon]HJN56767.1 branched-chain amino acid ABC transporter permease [Candidatus Woesearchaeota archaeon]|tara:strand:- start:3291 stop:4142 length:852 start_codon:yes stop_codon:yes gene_type:complete
MAFEYLINFWIFAFMYIILVVSLNLSMGFTGLINLGHLAFWGVGAYTSALLTLNGVPWYFAMLAAGIVAAFFGFILALPTSKIKGDYLAIVSLGLVFIMDSVVRNWTSLTRGALGLPGIPRITSSSINFLVFSFILAAVVYFFAYKLVSSKHGKIMQAVRDDETAAKVLGKNTQLYKIMSLVISTFMAGIAGSLFAHYITFIDPTIFSPDILIIVLSMLIVGGLASLNGAVFGAIIVLALSELPRIIIVVPALIGPIRDMTFALLVLIVLIYKPRGLFGKVDL